MKSATVWAGILILCLLTILATPTQAVSEQSASEDLNASVTANPGLPVYLRH